MYLICLKDVTKKVISFEMFLRGLWNVSLNGDLIEISQRNLMPAGSAVIFLSVRSSSTFASEMKTRFYFCFRLVVFKSIFLLKIGILNDFLEKKLEMLFIIRWKVFETTDALFPPITSLASQFEDFSVR